MATIKGPSGNATITFNGVEFPFTNYGTPPEAEAFAAKAMRTAVLTDATDPDSVEVISITRGRAVGRDDGKISLDLSDEPAITDVTLVYNRTTGSITEQVEATITVSAADAGAGWGLPRHYLPEVGADDAVVVAPGETTRLVHIATGGLSAADIAALESVSEGTITGTWLKNNTAIGEGGLYYGETSGLALDETSGLALARQLYITEYSAPHILFNRGDTFAALADGTVNRNTGGIGENRLHPQLTGAYGTGAKPRFTGRGFNLNGFASYQVIQGLSWGINANIGNNSAIIVDDCYADYAGATGFGTGYTLSASPTNNIIEGLTFRRFVSLDCTMDTPNGSMTEWEGSAARTSGVYFERARGALIEKVFVDHAGWDNGYRADASLAFPKAPEIYSHGGYFQQGTQDLTVRDCIFTANSHSAVQFRPGGVMHNVFAAGNNTGVNPGQGPIDVDTGGGQQGNWSILYRYVQTEAGFHGTDSGFGTIAVTGGGIVYDPNRVSFVDSIIINAGTPVEFASSTDIGPGVATSPPGTAHYFPTNQTETDVNNFRKDLVISGWNRPEFGDSNFGAVAEGTRDALTIGDFTDTLLTASGSTLADFRNHLRGQAAAGTVDWDIVTSVTDYFLAPFGKGVSTRSVAQTVTFLPDAAGDTPGIRADLQCDWDTGDLPGQVDGDGIDLAGHRVYWNLTPANTIGDFTFGKNGELVVFGGKLDVTGALAVHADGNTVWLGDPISGGGYFGINDWSGTGPLDVIVNESWFAINGTVTGNMNIVARYGAEVVIMEGGAFTLQSGRNLDVYGYAKVGFDGTGGGAAGLTLAAGSTLRFLPTIRMDCDGQTQITINMDVDPDSGSTPSVKSTYQPQPDAIVTSSGGAMGVTAKTLRQGNTQITLMLDGLTGTFLDNETLDADCEMAFFDSGAQTAFATVNGTPTPTLGQIREFRSGLNGFTATSVESSVTLGGTLHLDVTGVANGDYTLITADTVTGTFAAVTAAGNAAKDLTVSITGTTVAVNIASGSGGISGGTA